MRYFVEVEPGVRLFVEEVGYGRPVIFVHGWPVNRKMWEYQWNIVPGFGFRCIRIDLRGFGNSDAPLFGYNYNRMADDIRVIIDRLCIQQATLVGFSMGGAVSIRYVARHAGCGLCGLVLAAAAAPSMTQRPDYPYGQPAAYYDGIIQGLRTDRPNAIVTFGEAFFNKPVSEPFRDWFNGLGIEASSYGAIGGMMALRDEDLRGDLPQVRLKTTILHGKQDRIVPFALGELQHQGIAGSTLIPFEESGHGLFYDEREKFNQELVGALRGQTLQQPLTPQTPGMPQMSQMSQMPQLSQTPQTGQFPQSSPFPQTPQTSQTPQMPQTVQTPQASQPFQAQQLPQTQQSLQQTPMTAQTQQSQQTPMTAQMQQSFQQTPLTAQMQQSPQQTPMTAQTQQIPQQTPLTGQMQQTPQTQTPQAYQAPRTRR